MKFKHLVYPVFIQPTQIREMHEIIKTQEALKVGASVTLVELEETLKHYIETEPGNMIENHIYHVVIRNYCNIIVSYK